MLPRWQTPTVPEVAVDENGDAVRVKHDVRTAWERLVVTTKPQLHRPKLNLHEPFKRSVLKAYPLHCARALFGREMVDHSGVYKGTGR